MLLKNFSVIAFIVFLVQAAVVPQIDPRDDSADMLSTLTSSTSILSNFFSILNSGKSLGLFDFSSLSSSSGIDFSNLGSASSLGSLLGMGLFKEKREIISGPDAKTVRNNDDLPLDSFLAVKFLEGLGFTFGEPHADGSGRDSRPPLRRYGAKRDSRAVSYCPESSPCCSQFGICGTGAYCLGGCDIRHSYNLSSCMPMPRMDDYSITFNSKEEVEQIEAQTKYLGNSTEADWVYTGWVDYHDDSLLIQMPNHTTGTVVSSTKYLWYGKVSAKFKTSRSRGVISAFILFSDVQDEIDYEYVGYDLSTPQSNFYAQGILNYTNSRNSTVNDTFEYYHLYEIDWHEDHVDWIVDNEKVRTLNRADTWNDTTKRYDFPQTPSRIQFSLWPGGDPSNGLGTIEWAGGEIDWNSPDIQDYGYFYARLAEIKVECYDLPGGVKLDGNSTNQADYPAFLYNNTDGYESHVMLTNKKTWLGNYDATGFNPDNENENSSQSKNNVTTTIISTSGSSTITSVRTTTADQSVDIPAQNTAAANQATAAPQASDNDYDPNAGTGGFIQDSRESSTVAGSSTGGAAAITLEASKKVGLTSIFLAICLGFLSYHL
ncbi:UTR2 [Candida oxycetoniae]|uniref:UTR2 n=1 Tax=Candida oxycetoniae TaxID=497107 RepID=A0AAI9SSY5_9ASCO|nr:UTR2 [Candida oxycetoniae]KAI3402547.2 UTR2 [Candida oxycetoniae]